MSQSQYLKLIEVEIQKINKKIDLKIIRGEDYKREAKEHKLLIRKYRQNTKQGFFRKVMPFLFQF
jgi:hypothetical protein